MNSTLKRDVKILLKVIADNSYTITDNKTADIIYRYIKKLLKYQTIRNKYPKWKPYNIEREANK